MNNYRKIIALLAPCLLLIELLTGATANALSVNVPIAISIYTAAWMVSWWIFEILPLGVTALIPLIVFPLTSVLSIKQVAPNYSNSVIYLFLGGFIIARALEKTHLSERMALYILKYTGHSDRGILIGFIIATAFLSMWISNTATTVMMIPIAVSVLNFITKSQECESKPLENFSVSLFLSIAYAANIGGIMTPIGTPPNVVLMGYLDELYSRQIEFEYWMMAVVPIAVTVLCIMYVLIKTIFPFKIKIDKEFRVFLIDKIQALGTMNKKQKQTLIVFVTICLLWIFKGLIHSLIGIKVLNDTSIAIAGGAALFFLKVLDEEDIAKLPWNIVLLFGGGMALASTLNHVGLIQIAANYLASLDFSSAWALVLVTSASVLFLTEIMSNVALCVVALPLLLKLGETQGIQPLLIAIPATLCASFAFSMPISTPPNAIVFGTGRVRIVHMMKAGILLNLISIAVVMTLGWYLLKLLL
jgi:sodium-dependent dicarboxylate transporter 2/3/5